MKDKASYGSGDKAEAMKEKGDAMMEKADAMKAKGDAMMDKADAMKKDVMEKKESYGSDK